jgi:hypothetical protein
MMTIPTSGASPARQQLEALRRPLLHLHKALLDAERIGYERENGRIANGGALLQLVIGDPWFSWLRPMSGLIVMIDEHLEAKEERPDAEGPGLLEQARAMTKSDERFVKLIQEHPAVALAYKDVMRVLPTTQH